MENNIIKQIFFGIIISFFFICSLLILCLLMPFEVGYLLFFDVGLLILVLIIQFERRNKCQNKKGKK